MKTVVEWLEEKFNNNNAEFINWSADFFEQAKEMEKEQMESAYLAGESKDKQYYNETFNK